MMLPIIPDFRIESKMTENDRVRFYPFLNEENNKGLRSPSIDYNQHILPMEKMMNDRINAMVDASYDYLRKNDDEATIPIIKKRNELVFIKNIKVRIGRSWATAL